MAPSRVSRERIREIYDFHIAHGRSTKKTSAHFKLSNSTITDYIKLAPLYGIGGPAEKVVPDGFQMKSETIFLSPDGTPGQRSVTTRRESGEEYEIPQGYSVKGESAYVDPDGRVLAKWIKTAKDQSRDDWLIVLRDTLAEFKPAASIRPPILADDALLTVYVIPDAHIGMLAWGRETGADYDLSIALKSITGAVSDLVAQSRKSSNALVLWLGDTMHQDDASNKTPRSGHVLDVDGRYPKVLRAAAEISNQVIANAAQSHRNVLARFLPGNHDPNAAHALALASSMHFSQSKHIEINDDPSLHFYHRFGRVLIGATHGHTIKPDRMAMMLATDRPKDWGDTVHRHFFFGHVHHESARETGGVRVESFSSPAAKDAYAAGGGWRSNRALVAITFHKERGEIGRHRVNIS